MVVELMLKDCSQVRTYEDAKDVYQEGQLLCIVTDKKILKYPINSVFRVVEYPK